MTQPAIPEPKKEQIKLEQEPHLPDETDRQINLKECYLLQVILAREDRKEIDLKLFASVLRRAYHAESRIRTLEAECEELKKERLVAFVDSMPEDSTLIKTSKLTQLKQDNELLRKALEETAKQVQYWQALTAKGWGA